MLEALRFGFIFTLIITVSVVGVGACIVTLAHNLTLGLLVSFFYLVVVNSFIYYLLDS